MQAALSYPDAVLAAARAAWGGRALPAPTYDSAAAILSGSAAVTPFTLTLLGSATLVLRARVAAFAPGATVYIGNATSSNTLVSEDGMWLVTMVRSGSRVTSRSL